MPWICPTMGRPERLAELAASWDRNQPGKELHVRVWEGDRKRADYASIKWPDNWNLYTSSKRGAGEALNEIFKKNPHEDFYGFIADDIVLRTPGGLEILEETAKPWFVSYPNDVLQKHRLCTHFCVGGELAREMQGVVPPMFKHTYMDVGLLNIAHYFCLLRYCPQVIFQHKHFLVKGYGIEKDATYKMVYPGKGELASGELEDEGLKAMEEFRAGYFPETINRINARFFELFEDWERWEEEDAALYRSAG
ncbi:MAG: hypothetical protein ACWGQW_02805 [bacterium]